MPTGNRSACVATSRCTIPDKYFNVNMPGTVNVHMVVPTAHAHRPSSSWLHDSVLHRTLDCSDIQGEPDVWVLRPFDPYPDSPTPEIDAELLLLLADVGWMSRGKSSRRVIAPCVAPDKKGMTRAGVRMMWLGSYRRDPDPINFSTLLSALSPRVLVVLGGGEGSTASAKASASSSSADRATHFLLKQGIARRRLLVLPSARTGRRRRPSAADPEGNLGLVENAREVLQQAAKLVAPDWEARSQLGNFVTRQWWQHDR